MSAKGGCEKGKIHTGIDPGLAIECASCQVDAGSDKRGKSLRYGGARAVLLWTG
jgi:hypothetical protein